MLQTWANRLYFQLLHECFFFSWLQIYNFFRDETGVIPFTRRLLLLASQCYSFQNRCKEAAESWGGGEWSSGWVFVTWQLLQLFAVTGPTWLSSLSFAQSSWGLYLAKISSFFLILFHLDVSSWYVCVGERPGGVRSTLERYREGRKEILCSHQEDFPRTSSWICHACTCFYQ